MATDSDSDWDCEDSKIVHFACTTATVLCVPEEDWQEVLELLLKFKKAVVDKETEECNVPALEFLVEAAKLQDRVCEIHKEILHCMSESVYVCLRVYERK